MTNTYNKFSTGKTYKQFHPEEIKSKNVILMIKKLRDMYFYAGGNKIGLKHGKDLAEAMIEIEALKADNKKLKDLVIKLVDDR